MKIIKVLFLTIIWVSLCCASEWGFYGTRLIYAVTQNNGKLVKQILTNESRESMQINDKDRCGCTALGRAVFFGYKDMVELLLVRGADVNMQNYYAMQDHDGWTALICASSYGRTEIVKLLLNYRADINIKDNNGNTAIIHASSNGHQAVVKLLEDYKTIQSEYSLYKVKELNKIRYEKICEGTGITVSPLVDLINGYAGADFAKQDLENKNLLNFSQFRKQKEKKNAIKESNLKASQGCSCVIQ